MSGWNEDAGWGATAPQSQQNNWRSGNNDQNNSNHGGARGRGGFPNRGGGRGRGGPARDGQENRSNFVEGNTVILKVPSKCVGRIIGKGGSKIADLQFECDCKIIVTKETEDDFTIVKLIGSDGNIKKAESLINDLTVDREPRENRQEKAHKFLFGNGDDNFTPKETPEINWKELNAECEKYEAEKWSKLPPIQKDFYQELPEVANMSKDFVDQFRQENNNIVVARTFADKGCNKPIPNPVTTFHQAFHNFPEILDEIAKVGFKTPSPIQSQAWPVLLKGEDLIGIAQTGTGKTLAFLLPALIHIDNQTAPREERGGPGVLVMAPTRELALQIEKEVKKYYYKGIKAVCLYGGGSRRDQINVVNDGVDIVIATPGRLNDIINAGHIDPQSITYVVLDEADRMLDMGFEPQIRKTMYAIRPNRQTVMTSATWPLGVRRLAQSYMVDPVQVYVGSLDLAAVHTVTQTILLLPDDDNEKFNTFMDFARNLQPHEKVICFCGKKAKASFVASELALAGVECASIHGDLEQSDREQALVDIGDGTVPILVATDVASRGIDIEDITHVVNYDFPRNIEEYVHRVGRTGRAGKSGDSISYFTRADWGQAKELISILEEADQFVPDELHSMAKRFEEWKIRKAERPSGGGGFGGGRGRGGGGGGGYGGGGGGYGGGGGGYGGGGGGGGYGGGGRGGRY